MGNLLLEPELFKRGAVLLSNLICEAYLTLSCVSPLVLPPYLYSQTLFTYGRTVSIQDQQLL